MSYRTFCLTARPCTDAGVKFWCNALDKHPHIEKWWGGIEVKHTDDGVEQPDSQHIHVGVVLIKPVKKDVWDKWVIRQAEKSPAGKQYAAEARLKDHLKMMRGGVKVWYSWDWFENYIQGKWMQGREPFEHKEWVVPLFPEKGDTGLVRKTGREARPTPPDVIATLWKRDYGDAIPYLNAPLVSRYIEYLQYETKEIGLIEPHALKTIAYHVCRLLEKPKGLPVMDAYNDQNKESALHKMMKEADEPFVEM